MARNLPEVERLRSVIRFLIHLAFLCRIANVTRRRLPLGDRIAKCSIRATLANKRAEVVRATAAKLAALGYSSPEQRSRGCSVDRDAIGQQIGWGVEQSWGWRSSSLSPTGRPPKRISAPGWLNGPHHPQLCSTPRDICFRAESSALGIRRSNLIRKATEP